MFEIAHALEPSEVFERAQTHVVIVTAFDGDQKLTAQANGLSVSPLDVVTNCHVVKAARRIDVQHGAETRSAQVKFQDLARNLCQLSLATPLSGARPVTTMKRSSEVKTGQTVFAVGAPYGEDYTFVRGMVAGLRTRPGESAKLIQTDVAVSPGLSGSGLFDQNGELLGLITAGLTDSQNLNIVLPVEWIEELPKRNIEHAANRNDVATAPAAAAPSDAVPAPSAVVDVLPGTRFRYRMSTPRKTLGTVTIEVLAVEGSKVRERITLAGYNNFRFDRATTVTAKPEAFQPLIKLPGGYPLPEVSPYFPRDAKLRVGERWGSLGAEYYLPGFGNRQLVTQVRVAGIEHVTVPAGKFEAWRIETLSESLYYQSSPLTFKCIYWYPTTGRRTVKMEIEVLANIETARSKEIYELLSVDQGN